MSALRELMTGGRIVAYYPALARALGSIPGALLLQQIAHLQGDKDYCKDGEWVEVSQPELEQMLAMTPRMQQGARNRLAEVEVLDERRPERKGAAVKYRILWDDLEDLLGSTKRKSKPRLNTYRSRSPKRNPPIEEGKEVEQSSTDRRGATTMVDRLQEQLMERVRLTPFGEKITGIQIASWHSEIKSRIEKRNQTVIYLWALAEDVLEASRQGFFRSFKQAEARARQKGAHPERDLEGANKLAEEIKSAPSSVSEEDMMQPGESFDDYRKRIFKPEILAKRNGSSDG